MSPENVLSALEANRLMAVIRTATAEDAVWAAGILADEGFQLFDVTYGTPDTERVISTLRENHPETLVGAGTVMTVETAKKAMDAGAQFLLSPSFDPAIVQFANENNILFLPGVTTPTEMAMAIQTGAKALKFFPAGCIGGANYLKTVLAPLRNDQIASVPVVATGGIKNDDINDYLDAGALAVGTGSHLLPTKYIESRNEEKLRKRARKYLNSVCSKEHDREEKSESFEEKISSESDLMTPLA